MKIIIENFGIIKRFEFDLDKDFTLIFGKNSSGKSYAISVIYLIVKNWLDFQKKCKLIDDDIKIIANLIQREFVIYLTESIKNSFDGESSLQNRFSSQNLKIFIIFENLNFELILDNKNLEIINLDMKKKILYNSLTKIDEIYFLPASRSGLYQALSAFGQIFAQLSQSRNFINKKVEIPSITEPVSDYFLELSNINSKNSDDNVAKIAKDMEKDILNGEVIFNNETKKLSFIPNDTDLNLDLSFTSSMISEISPIVAFLKYILNTEMGEYTKPILIIEEPESHLHPEIQIKLMKYFAKLSQSGVKIIMTTHSDYMFNKFNNMIFAKELDRQKSQSIFFKIKKEGSEAEILEIDEFGVDDENFVDASDELYNEKMQLIDKFNNDEL